MALFSCGKFIFGQNRRNRTFAEDAMMKGCHFERGSRQRCRKLSKHTRRKIIEKISYSHHCHHHHHHRNIFMLHETFTMTTNKTKKMSAKYTTRNKNKSKVTDIRYFVGILRVFVFIFFFAVFVYLTLYIWKLNTKRHFFHPK